MSDNPRIEELRRRVQKDPASIAFAQLAEEYRRTGNYKDAIAVCRAGLAIHPGYISARVTLGRALIEINDLVTAEIELKAVLRSAPDNLAAIRALAEAHHRSGRADEALRLYKTALDLSGNDPELEHKVEKISQSVKPPEPRRVAPAVARIEPASVAAASAVVLVAPIVPVSPVAAPPAELGRLAALEQFLEAIQVYRQRQAGRAVKPAAPGGLPQLERFLDAIHSYRQRQAV